MKERPKLQKCVQRTRACQERQETKRKGHVTRKDQAVSQTATLTITLTHKIDPPTAAHPESTHEINHKSNAAASAPEAGNPQAPTLEEATDQVVGTNANDTENPQPDTDVHELPDAQKQATPQEREGEQNVTGDENAETVHDAQKDTAKVKAPTNWSQFRSWEAIPDLAAQDIPHLKVSIRLITVSQS